MNVSYNMRHSLLFYIVDLQHIGKNKFINVFIPDVVLGANDVFLSTIDIMQAVHSTLTKQSQHFRD